MAHHCPLPTRLRVLGESPIFGRLPESALEKIDTRCRAIHLTDNEVAYHAGQEAQTLYVVASGALKLTRPSLEGYDVLIDVVGAGDFLGMLTALGEASFPDTATSMGQSCILAFTARDFRAVLDEFPTVTLAALDAVSARLSEARRVVRELAADTADQRIGSALVRLAARIGSPHAGATRVSVAQSELAAMAGTTPETVSRTLGSWREKRLVATGRGTITIADVDQLADHLMLAS